MNMQNSVTAPLLVAILFLSLAVLRVTWHQSAAIPAICAVLLAVKAFINLKKRKV